MSEIFKKYIMVALTAMVPVAELRASIPAGIAMGLEPWPVLVFSVLGNLVPVPFIILFVRKILSKMTQCGGFLGKVSMKVEEKAAKGAKLFYKWELFGLLVLVAIPFPGTGAWTGALVAATLNIRMKYSLPVIAAGVVIAGVLMLILSKGVSALF